MTIEVEYWILGVIGVALFVLLHTVSSPPEEIWQEKQFKKKERFDNER